MTFDEWFASVGGANKQNPEALALNCLVAWQEAQKALRAELVEFLKTLRHELTKPATGRGPVTRESQEEVVDRVLKELGQ